MANRFLFVVLFLLATAASYGQIFISTDHRYIYENSESGYKLVTDYDEMTLFEVSLSGNMFEHTTKDIKSAYYVESTTKLDNGLDVWMVHSDVGNKYAFVFDINSKEVRALTLGITPDKKIVYRIKSSWTKEKE